MKVTAKAIPPNMLIQIVRVSLIIKQNLVINVEVIFVPHPKRVHTMIPMTIGILIQTRVQDLNIRNRAVKEVTLNTTEIRVLSIISAPPKKILKTTFVESMIAKIVITKGLAVAILKRDLVLMTLKVISQVS